MSLTYEKLPQEPILRTWEVNETHTRFDYYQSQPSDNALHVQFIILATTNALVAVATFMLLYSILTSVTLRVNPFNWYLVFITLPDFIMSFSCLFACVLSAPLEKFYSEWMCSFQSMYLVFGLCANCWMNFFIVYEVHKLLRHSNYRRRYFPPKRTTVVKQALGVYLYAILWGLLGIFPIPWLPHSTYVWYGVFCFPQEYNRASTFFYWLLFIPAIMGIPIFYVAYVCGDIWKRNLLPPEGRRRNLAVFFVRLICVYFLMWMPTIVIRVICNFWNAGAWVSWTGAFWSHMQGFISVIVALTKGDVRKAVVDNFWCCMKTEPLPKPKEPGTGTVRTHPNSFRRTRRSMGISVMHSFNRYIQPSFLRSHSTANRQDALDAFEDSGDAEDKDLTDSAAMQAIQPAVPIESLTSATSEYMSYLSGFDDDDDRIVVHDGGILGDDQPRIIDEENITEETDRDTDQSPPGEEAAGENRRGRAVAFCIPSDHEDWDGGQSEEEKTGECMSVGS